MLYNAPGVLYRCVLYGIPLRLEAHVLYVKKNRIIQIIRIFRIFPIKNLIFGTTQNFNQKKS